MRCLVVAWGTSSFTVYLEVEKTQKEMGPAAIRTRGLSQNYSGVPLF